MSKRTGRATMREVWHEGKRVVSIVEITSRQRKRAEQVGARQNNSNAIQRISNTQFALERC